MPSSASISRAFRRVRRSPQVETILIQSEKCFGAFSNASDIKIFRAKALAIPAWANGPGQRFAHLRGLKVRLWESVFRKRGLLIGLTALAIFHPMGLGMPGPGHWLSKAPHHFPIPKSKYRGLMDPGSGFLKFHAVLPNENKQGQDRSPALDKELS